MQAQQHTDSRHWLVKAAFAAVVAIAAIEEMDYVRHRMSRAYDQWWRRVKHRQNTEVDAAALEFLARRLAHR